MNRLSDKMESVDQVVNAVLYEGYVLYPYRPSSLKNRKRFTFGCVYPEAYHEAQHGAEPCVMQTECLVEGAAPALDIRVRFLHPMAREVGRLAKPAAALEEDEEPDFDVVPVLHINGDVYHSWQEAVEREAPLPTLSVDALVDEGYEEKFEFSSSRAMEPIHDQEDRVIGVVVRRQQALRGRVTVVATPVSDGAYRITVRIFNDSPVEETHLARRDDVILYTFASTHTVLGVDGGAFISLMDPPEAYAAPTAACTNDGTWPVLVGDEARGERDILLSSPIILYDYPEVAPESPGDFFDSTEIDELLTLRIQTMTEDEKNEMRQADLHARRLLHRTENMSGEKFMNLHGTMREVQSQKSERNNGSLSTEGLASNGTRPVPEATYEVGARVRIHPKGRADGMDMMLKGKTAVIEAVEQDFEDRVYLALVLDDDPGKDLGMMRQPGHRFFYSPEEVELVT